MDKIRALAQQIGMSADKAQYLAEVFGEDDFTNVIAPSLKRRKAADSAIASTGIAYKGQRSTTPSIAELVALHTRTKAALDALTVKFEAIEASAKQTAPKNKTASAQTGYARAFPGLYVTDQERAEKSAQRAAEHDAAVKVLPGLRVSDQERAEKAAQQSADEKAARRVVPGMFAKSDDGNPPDYSRIFPGLFKSE